MDSIKNVGVINPSVAMKQQTPIQELPQDYAAMPMAYEPEMEEKKKASSNMLGMTLMGVLAAGGLIYGWKKGSQVKTLNNTITELRSNNEKLAKDLDTANEKIKELTPKTIKEKFKDFFKKTFFHPTKWFNSWGKGGKTPPTPPTPPSPPAA